eukprot:scaffold6592_cov411-Prasinococcus_capsulatus_cf.AAC.3
MTDHPIRATRRGLQTPACAYSPGRRAPHMRAYAGMRMLRTRAARAQLLGVCAWAPALLVVRPLGGRGALCCTRGRAEAKPCVRALSRRPPRSRWPATNRPWRCIAYQQY